MMVYFVSGRLCEWKEPWFHIHDYLFNIRIQMDQNLSMFAV